jgi:hypothetical protein
MLNRKIMTKENFCKDVTVQAQKNAWMTSDLMEDWLGCVWEWQPGALLVPLSVLARDAFRGHLSNRIRNTLRNSLNSN